MVRQSDWRSDRRSDWDDDGGDWNRRSGEGRQYEQGQWRDHQSDDFYGRGRDDRSESDWSSRGRQGSQGYGGSGSGYGGSYGSSGGFSRGYEGNYGREGGRGFERYGQSGYGGYSGGYNRAGGDRSSSNYGASRQGGWSGGSGYGSDRNWSSSEPYGFESDDSWSGEGSGRSRYGQSGQGGDKRGFMDRASDEVASWFGDRDAEQRRRQDQYRGVAPKGYTRSDDRIREDVNDRLTDDPFIDAADIEVSVSKSEVTLSGNVSSREQRRRAEDIAEDILGVGHVQNNIRVKSASTGFSGRSGSGSSDSDYASGTTSGAGTSGRSSLTGGTSQTGGSAQTGGTSQTGGTAQKAGVNS